MNSLRVRMYGVRFGDAILVSIPERDAAGHNLTRHIVIDIGNVLTGEGGRDLVYQPVMKNILDELAGQPADLYIMTHEHMDHVQGPIYSDAKLQLKLTAKNAWLTASADPNYYETHKDAKKQLSLFELEWERINAYLSAVPSNAFPLINAMMLNNNPRSTAECVAYLRNIASNPPTYVYRGCDLGGKHTFNEAQFKILAPEEDTSVYYGRFRPAAFTLGKDPLDPNHIQATTPLPPPGVDGQAFYDLVENRARGYFDNIMAIDKARNNTSVVFMLSWHGWKLLFTGDAEDRSWRTMDKHGQLEPIHFLKVSHHGSDTGLPRDEQLDKIFPVQSHDGRQRCALVSTYPDTYKDVPAKELIETALSPRCSVHWVDKDKVPDGDYIDIEFPEDGTKIQVTAP